MLRSIGQVAWACATVATGCAGAPRAPAPVAVVEVPAPSAAAADSALSAQAHQSDASAIHRREARDAAAAPADAGPNKVANGDAGSGVAAWSSLLPNIPVRAPRPSTSTGLRFRRGPLTPREIVLPIERGFIGWHCAAGNAWASVEVVIQRGAVKSVHVTAARPAGGSFAACIRKNIAQVRFASKSGKTLVRVLLRRNAPNPRAPSP